MSVKIPVSASIKPDGNCMTTQSPIVIGELIISGAHIGQQRYPIEACHGYGITCYPLGSLNGSITAIARGLVGKFAGQLQMRGELNDSTYSVTVSLDGADIKCQSIEVVAEQLTDLYKRHTKS